MTHTNYQDQAREFLNRCNATMTITYIGKSKPLWDNRLHSYYVALIKTTRGEMKIDFYDSIHNTEIMDTSLEDYVIKKYRCHFSSLTYTEKVKAQKQLLKMKEDATPTEYDILSCLQKYDAGTLDDFISDFGYEVKSGKDLKNLLITYQAVQDEYRDICRCFTPEQIEELQEIQ